MGRLKTVNPDKSLVVGSYAYLDGELHVRLSLAMDAIVKGLTESREHVMVRIENCQRCVYPEPWFLKREKVFSSFCLNSYSFRRIRWFQAEACF